MTFQKGHVGYWNGKKQSKEMINKRVKKIIGRIRVMKFCDYCDNRILPKKVDIIQKNSVQNYARIDFKLEKSIHVGKVE